MHIICYNLNSNFIINEQICEQIAGLGIYVYRTFRPGMLTRPGVSRPKVSRPRPEIKAKVEFNSYGL